MNEKTLMLSSGQCSWKKCVACGWGQLKAPVDMDGTKRKVEALDLAGVEMLKVFASGSFLDDAQFTKEFRIWFADYIRKKGIKELLIESRTEYITQENLDDFKGIKLTVATGLECADNEVLKRYDKGFTVEDVAAASELLHKNGAKLRTYIMVNMPYTKEDSLDKSVAFAKKYADSFVLINTFPHSKSKLFDMWVDGKWSPLSTKEFEALVKKYDKVEIDSQNYMFIPKFPQDKKEKLVGASTETLNHKFFNVWQDFFQRFYEVPEGKKDVLFLQCAFKKPYTKSNTHKKINEVISQFDKFNKETHRVVLSTPGAVPLEYDDYYPLNDYDWPEWEETPELMEEYKKVVGERIKGYLKAHPYRKYYHYLKGTETYQALKKAADELGIELISLVDEPTLEKVHDEKNPLITPEMLAALKKKLSEIAD